MICKICKKEVDFYKNNHSTCKKCVAIRSKEWKLNNPKQAKLIRKKATNKWLKKNPQKITEYNRKNYKKNGRARSSVYQEAILSWKSKNPDAIKAHWLVNKAIKGGEICVPKFCEKCKGQYILNAHHDDYHQPLKIVWLCHSCHKRLHLDI